MTRGEKETDYRFGSRPVLVGHKVFLLGDYFRGPAAARGHLGDVLDTKSLTWEKLPSSYFMQKRLIMHTANLVDDRIVIFGVSTMNAVGLPDVYSLDPATLEFSQVPSYGKNIGFAWEHTADYYEEERKLFIFGGASRRQPFTFFNALRILRVDDMTWDVARPKGQPPPAMFRHNSCISCGTLFIIGGRGSRASNQRLFRISGALLHLIRLDVHPSKYKWEMVKAGGNGPGKVSGAATCNLGDGRILLFGGMNDIEALNELYVLENCGARKPEWKHITNNDVKYKWDGHRPPSMETAGFVELNGRFMLLGGTYSDDEGCSFFELTISP